LRETRDSLLAGHVETRHIDAEILAEIGEGEGEWVVGSRARRSADCGVSLVLAMAMKARQG
jgi:hypothetical protein